MDKVQLTAKAFSAVKDDSNSDNDESAVNRRLLRQNIVQWFSEADVKALCFDMHIDFEILAGEEKTGKAISLIEYCERNGRINDLLRLCKIERPEVIW